MTYQAIQQVIGHVLNLIVGIVTLAAAVAFVGGLTRELARRPRFSIRMVLLAVAILPPILGAMYFVIPWQWLLLLIAIVAVLVIVANRKRKNDFSTP